MRQDLSQMPVQIHPCMTCPFEGEKPLVLTPKSYARYVANIVNLEGQHRCHSANNKMLCRGGRNLLLRVLCAYSLITAPTDAAFSAASIEAISKQEEENEPNRPGL